LIAGPAFAARPLLDKHQWDAYFALFARDAYVPWKTTTVRLDTYSGAPVDFAAYNVDPAEVIVAGQNRSARALDTSKLRPLVRWRFSPPPGYRFESSDVPVPLGSQEGFYVVEARRGDAVQQVWLNRSHVGLLTKESPEGLVVWGVDLRSGRALANMEVSFLVGQRLIPKKTDASGTIVWRDPGRPSFALAESGAGRAFVSILPQAPVPAAIVGVRLDSAVARAGEGIRFVGFARKRIGGRLRPATGSARVMLAGRGATLATEVAHIDAAGAFSGELAVPLGTEAGEFAVLASAAGGVGGTALQVDAAGDVALAVRPLCPCDPDRDVPFAVVAKRGDAPAADVVVRVVVVRTPHVVPPGALDSAVRWGTTEVVERSVRTDATGAARVAIPSPTDGLDSTYGIRATTRGATATSRIVVANAAVSLALEANAPSADVGEPIGFDVRGFSPADGAPAAGAVVTVRLSHGASEQEQTATLDARGLGHVIFKQTSLGSNLAIAETRDGGRRALDATAVVVEPSALSGQTLSAQSDVTVALDKPRYRIGDRIAVRAAADGATGDAFVTLEGARTYAMRLASVAGGGAATTLDVGDPQGAVRVSAAFVRDGAIATGDAAVALDAPGHARLTDITLDRATYAAGDVAHLTIHDGAAPPGSTIALRVADGRESGPALFDDAPDVLAGGATSEQAPASADPEWHAYVEPARSKANDIFAAERPRKAGTEVPSIGVAAPRTLLWQVARAESGMLDFTVPNERGHYVVSILKMSDDGDVGAASVAFSVETAAVAPPSPHARAH
jgi:hypothetical protein